MKKQAFAVLGALTAITLSACEELDALEDEEKNDTPTVVHEGKAFTHDKFEVASGWTIANETYGGVTIKKLSVTNKGDDQRTAILTFRFYKGKSVLAEVSCDSNQMQSGETSALDCYSTASKFPKGYTVVKVSDFW